MEPERQKQYLLLIAGLLLIACVVWYLSTRETNPSQDAVLAYGNERKSYTTDAKRMVTDGGIDPCPMKFCI